MWSLGCVAAELFLGLPLFPGASEHDLMTRIVEMLGVPPESVMSRSKHTAKYFRTEPSTGEGLGTSGSGRRGLHGSSPPPLAGVDEENPTLAGLAMSAAPTGPMTYVLYNQAEFEARLVGALGSITARGWLYGMACPTPSPLRPQEQDQGGGWQALL